MKESVRLERFAWTPFGVFGRLAVNGFSCFTVERPWQDNRAGVSCIPEGTYSLHLGYFHKGNYPAYELLDVPGRSEIKIHIGNTMDDLSGCIAPGMRLGFVKEKWAVTSSATALERFMAAMGGIRESEIRITGYVV